MSTLWLVSVLVSSVGNLVLLTIVTGVGVGSLDGDSGRVTNVLQLPLGIGRDSVTGLVTT